MSDVSGLPLDLPCGLFHDGKLIKTVEIKKLTGRVRKLIAQPSIRNDGAKVIDTVLQGCIVKLGDIEYPHVSVIRKLLMADRDFLTMNIRIHSQGGIVNAQHTCASCSAKLDVKINIEEMMTEFKGLDDLGAQTDEDGERFFNVTDADKELDADFRYPIGEDQHAVAKKAKDNPIDANYTMYARMLKRWGTLTGPFSLNFFDDIDVDVVDAMEDALGDSLPGIDMQSTIACEECGTENPVSMESSDFLFNLPKRDNK